jgi:hypothetical protein
MFVLLVESGLSLPTADNCWFSLLLQFMLEASMSTAFTLQRKISPPVKCKITGEIRLELNYLSPSRMV